MGSVSLINGHIDDDTPKMTPQEAIEKIKWIMQNKSHNKELCNICIEALEKQIPKMPLKWEYWTVESPIPNDDWGYECPCCGNQDIDYPEHHCTCGQALDWGDNE
jgi:hypothetical protein